MSVFIKYPKSLVYLRVKFVVILTVKTYTNRSKKKKTAYFFVSLLKLFFYKKPESKSNLRLTNM